MELPVVQKLVGVGGAAESRYAQHMWRILGARHRRRSQLATPARLLLGLTILTTLDPMRIEEIGTLEAKANLSSLLNQVLEGKSFYLTRRGKRIAELRPVAPPSRSRQAGFAKGTFTYIAPDFDAPLDDFADYR